MISMVPKKYCFCTDMAAAGWRLDQYLAAQMDGLSRGQLRKVIDLGGVHVDGRRIRQCSFALAPETKIEVFLDGRALEPFELKEAHILFRDPYLIVLNKPAGVETQPTPARYRGTLYQALQQFLHNPFRPRDRAELGMVQRLDRDTSGVMVFSTHKRSHRNLSLAFAGRGAEKTYLALVAGVLADKSGEIRSYLARNRASNRVRSVAKGGKEAITRYRVLEEFPAASLLEIELLTGRSHQIRAHFSEAGHALLGDVRYGGAARIGSVAVARQMLHAVRLSLPHPVTAEPLVFESPLPEDFLTVLTHLRDKDCDFSATAPC
ncbi:MAG: RluA family pseudouridine synthase [Desulfuromonadaceae bacterium]